MPITGPEIQFYSSLIDPDGLISLENQEGLAAARPHVINKDINGYFRSADN